MHIMDVTAKIQLTPRHQPSGMAIHFDADSLTFAEYVQRSIEMLRQVHADKADIEKIVAGNAPFELHPVGDFQVGSKKPYKRGVLLIHGLSDSPYQMRHLAAPFQRNGFSVMAILLPGHGTQPGDLLDVRWQAWAKAVAYGVACLNAEVDEIYLAGYSIGAALSIYHSAQDERVRGLFLFSPAIEIAAKARWANIHKFYSWLLPTEAWVNVMPDCDIYKYESFCKNAAAQAYALIRALPKKVPNIPIFTAASADDVTVYADATLRFMKQAQHPYSKLLWYAKENIDQHNVDWVNSVLLDQRILSSAHTAIVLPPEDVYYGAEGEYVNCLHYYPYDMGSYQACLAQRQNVRLGEVNEENLKQDLLRRLVFNPHYAEMENSMQKFIGRLP
jgi:esterase/lipase